MLGSMLDAPSYPEAGTLASIGRGGRSNYLTTEISLLEFNCKKELVRSSSRSFTPIPLRVSLYYESGKRVDESDQDIFRFVGDEYDAIVIRDDTRSATIHFRLEKVSRRKDGQRFKLKIEPYVEQCPVNLDDLAPVFTTAICVLSKRKYPSQDASHRAKVLKTLPVDAIADTDGVRAQLQHLQRQNDRMLTLLEAQHEMLLTLARPLPKTLDLDALLKAENAAFRDALDPTESNPTLHNLTLSF
ncbi:hypothetical protein SPRG_07280 [Saprolegnia parasitica CBS 223.65]|uniref:Uncharacterized protein n=1 Tax=Saprolegnia parasitica (strain CBS 223.65) TaxID=695850 RepID=A0A067CN74_SAPPC|nr:hypothetical protein SPRG_07280 [Saprolegnia parasitica CBS 223.65]KDO28001.1 hypothetical protein SPRG_07280 [Saprolegnia parasitica CBS 223.65]|eukprot:XP_012201449.1 hypothetical protein SPRG_07280 [Saprolegnia parasitica CBS 223.65]